MSGDPVAAWSAAAFPRTLLADDAGHVLGSGLAWEATADGPGRGSRLERALGRLEGEGPAPWVLGALAFEESSRLPSPWGSLPGARLWVPARLEVQRAGTSLVQERSALAVERAQPAPWPTAHDDFRELVDDATGLIRDGAFRKLVLARAVDAELPADHDDARVLRRLLSDAGHGVTVYAHDLPDGSLWMGATPEVLLEAQGARVTTHALAGTCAARGDAAEDAAAAAGLVASTKDRKEHGLVVEHLVMTLRPRCQPFSVDQAPQVRHVGRLIHLETRIEAELLDPDHLDVIAALHPTPATCGMPMAPAAHWLARHERLRRGLYCGALGWLSPSGCRAVVPLRGALLSPDRRRARLFAGAGIVETSDPGREYAETELKLGLMRRMLGVAPPG